MELNIAMGLNELESALFETIKNTTHNNKWCVQLAKYYGGYENDEYITLAYQSKQTVDFVLEVNIDANMINPFTVIRAVALNGSPTQLAQVVNAIADYEIN